MPSKLLCLGLLSAVGCSALEKSPPNNRYPWLTTESAIVRTIDSQGVLPTPSPTDPPHWLFEQASQLDYLSFFSRAKEAFVNDRIRLFESGTVRDSSLAELALIDIQRSRETPYYIFWDNGTLLFAEADDTGDDFLENRLKQYLSGDLSANSDLLDRIPLCHRKKNSLVAMLASILSTWTQQDLNSLSPQERDAIFELYNQFVLKASASYTSGLPLDNTLLQQLKSGNLVYLGTSHIHRGGSPPSQPDFEGSRNFPVYVIVYNKKAKSRVEFLYKGKKVQTAYFSTNNTPFSSRIDSFDLTPPEVTEQFANDPTRLDVVTELRIQDNGSGLRYVVFQGPGKNLRIHTLGGSNSAFYPFQSIEDGNPYINPISGVFAVDNNFNISGKRFEGGHR